MENLIAALKLQLSAVKLQADAAWKDKERMEKDWHKYYGVQGALETTIKHLESQMPTPPAESSAAVMP